jgi:D-3-phosphoglycerate dehydrogenase
MRLPRPDARSKTRLTEEVLDEAENLMCVGCFCIGTDQTDLLHAASMGVPVFNSPCTCCCGRDIQ